MKIARSSAGATIFPTSNSPVYRLHGAVISAVVLDMVMPGLSGRDTYLALRAVTPDVRVLLMSGYTMNEEVEAILELGVRSFLSKPYSMEALARELEVLTHLAPAADEPGSG